MEDRIYKLILERPLLFATEPFLRRSRFLEEYLVYLHILALRASERKPHVFRDAIRNQKLKRLLTVATRLPFWKERIGSELLGAEKPLSQLHFLPVTSKDDFRNAPLEQRTNQDIAAKYGVLNFTSGSTGEPLQFFIDKRLKIRQWALLSRVGGLQRFSRQSLIHLWPTPNPNPLFSGHFFSAKTTEELWHRRLEIYRLASRPNSILHGSPSLLRLLLEFAEQDKVVLRPHRVITSSEELTPETRLFFQEQFQCKVANYYGSRELSVMAGQCEFGRFHENSEDVIFEVVSEQGLPLNTGEVGRLITTGLNSYVAPFIHYHLGDYGFIYKDPCPCDNPLPSFNFEGRTHDVTPILLPDGSHILPYRLTGIFNRRFEKIRQYQIDHCAPYSFIVDIVPTEKYHPSDEQELLVHFRQATRGSQVAVRRVASIPSSGPKVLPYIKSF